MFDIQLVPRLVQILRMWPLVPLLGLAITAYAAKYGENPYSIALGKRDDKVAEFNAIRAPDIRWDGTRVLELDRGLFVDSISKNRNSDLPYANRYQRYNYVVKDNKILVAVWATDSKTVRAVCKKAPIVSRHYLEAKIVKNAMVNFFPEATDLPNSPVPVVTAAKACESIASSGKATGVLDGHSKHFMLVQGKGKRLNDYRLSTRRELSSAGNWLSASADYAGEMIIDVQSCYYIINQGSGTYEPKAGSAGDRFQYLRAVAELFEKEVGTPPAALWDTKAKHLIPTTQFGAKDARPLECGEFAPKGKK